MLPCPSQRTLSSNPEAVRSREPCQSPRGIVQQRHSGSGVSHARNAGVDHPAAAPRMAYPFMTYPLSVRIRFEPPGETSPASGVVHSTSL